MAKFYALQIKMNRITLESVPQKWRAETEALLNG